MIEGRTTRLSKHTRRSVKSWGWGWGASQYSSSENNRIIHSQNASPDIDTLLPLYHRLDNLASIRGPIPTKCGTRLQWRRLSHASTVRVLLRHGRPLLLHRWPSLLYRRSECRHMRITNCTCRCRRRLELLHHHRRRKHSRTDHKNPDTILMGRPSSSGDKCISPAEHRNLLCARY